MPHIRTTRFGLAGLFSSWTAVFAAGLTTFALGAGLMSLALAHPHPEADTVTAKLVNPADEAQIAALVDEVADRRVVMVGEMHDRYDHHLNQLAVIRGLHTRGVRSPSAWSGSSGRSRRIWTTSRPAGST